MKLGKIATSFSRGLSQAATHTLDQLECQTSENFLFKDRSATVRTGIKVHATLSTPAPVIALEKFYKTNGDTYFCAVANGQLNYSITSGAFTSISSEPISGDVRHMVYDGALYFTDFSSAIKYFNGGTVGIAGLSSPQYRYQLSDMEDVTKWSNNGLGAAIEDTNYMHRDKGDKSVTFTASSPSAQAIFQFGGVDHTIESVMGSGGAFLGLNNAVNLAARNSSGTIYFLDRNKNLFTSYNNGSTWSASSIISSLSGLLYGTYDNGESFPITIDRSGNLLTGGFYDVGGNSPFVIYRKASSSSVWATVASASTSTPYTNTINNAFAVDMSNNIHAVFYGTDTNSVKEYRYARMTNSAGIYTTSVSTLYYTSSLSAIPRDERANIIVDRNNNHHILMEIRSDFLGSTSGGIYYINSISSPIYKITSGLVDGDKWRGAIGTDTSSNIHVVITDDATNHVGYRKMSEAGAWDTSSIIAGSSVYSQYRPTIEINSNNRVNVLWAGNSFLYPSFPALRYATNISSWEGPVDLFQFTKLNVIGFNEYTFENIGSTQANRVNTGYAYIYVDPDGNYKYKTASNIKWDGDPTDPLAFNLNYFGTTDVSSTGHDLIQLFVVPNKRSQISSFILRFVDSATLYASKELVQTSAWTSISSDEWGMTLSVSKSSFTLSDTAFNWGSCNMETTLTPVSSSGSTYLAKVAVDNIRMLKSPPVIAYSVSTTANTNQLFFGSSATEKKVTPRFKSRLLTGNLGAPDPTIPISDVIEEFTTPLPTAIDNLQLEGLKEVDDPLPSGTYYYKCTFVKPSPSGYEVESNPSGQSSGWIVSNSMSSWSYLGLSNVPIAPESFGVSGRRVYRRRSKEEVMRHVYTIHDNQTTTFFDTVPNQALGWILEEDNYPPPNAKFIRRGTDERTYYYNVSEFGESYPSRIRVSKPYEPYYVPIELTFDISPEDGTEGTGMFDLNGVMYFLKERSTWALQGQVVPLSPSIGCIAPDSIAVGPNEAFWLSENGPIKFNGRFYNISHSMDNRSLYRIQTILDRLPKDYIKNARGTYYNGFYLLAVTDEGSTVNNLVLCYDIDNDVWTTFPNLQVNCWSTWNGYKDGYRLFFGNYSGQICEFFTGNYDISTPISWSIRSKEFGVTSPEEFVRKSFIFAENLDALDKTINIQPYYDFVQSSADYTPAIMSGTATYSKLKAPFPGADSASFFSLGISGSGRIKINVAEIYTKQENLR